MKNTGCVFMDPLPPPFPSPPPLPCPDFAVLFARCICEAHLSRGDKCCLFLVGNYG